MSTLQIAIIIVILAIMAYFLLGKKKKVNQKSNRNLEDLAINDRLEISGFGPHNDFLTVEIKNKNEHTEEQEDLFWYEFEGTTNRNEDFWLQLESIEPYELNGGYTKINIYELGVTVEDLMNQQGDNPAFRYSGQDFFFDCDGDAKCNINGSSKSYLYSYLEFTNEDDDIYITVEAVENEEPIVYLSYNIDVNQIQILS